MQSVRVDYKYGDYLVTSGGQV